MNEVEKLIESRVDAISEEIAHLTWYNELQDELILLQQDQSHEIKQLLRKVNAINDEILYNTSMSIYRKAFIDGTQYAAAMAPVLAPD